MKQTAASQGREALLSGQCEVMLWILLFLVDNIELGCGVMVHNKKDIIVSHEKRFDFAIVSRFEVVWARGPP